MTITKEQIAKDLLSIRAVFLKPDDPFTWASGIHSPIYCDNRLTLSAPAVRKDVEAGLAEIVKEKFPEAEMLMAPLRRVLPTQPLPLPFWTCPWVMCAPVIKTTAAKTKLRAKWSRALRSW